MALLLPLALSACAAGVEQGGFDLDIDRATADAASMAPPTMLPPIQEGGVILPPLDAGMSVPVVPDLPRDAGATTIRDTGASAPKDSGPATPVDSGSQTPLDSGSQTPLDSGSQTPRDSGSQTQPDTGGGTTANMCSTTPAYSTSTECGKCTCMRCATQVASCYASTDAAKNTQCAAVRSCAEKNNCIGTGCYCGSSLLCLSPDGPCLQEIETAAGGAGLTAVQTASTDPENPVGRSVPVGECQMLNCQRECGL